jgi:hypothetical protein
MRHALASRRTVVNWSATVPRDPGRQRAIPNPRSPVDELRAVMSDYIRAMRWVAAVTALASACAHPGAPPRSSTSGLAIGAGVGYQVPAIGGEVLYHHALSPSLWLVPYVGVGAFPIDDVVRPGFAGGAMLAWGRTHRLAVDLGVGLAAVAQRVSLVTGETVDTRDFYGATAAAGYQLVTAGGFFLHALVGASVLLAEPPSGEGRWVPTLNLTFGYKIW